MSAYTRHGISRSDRNFKLKLLVIVAAFFLVIAIPTALQIWTFNQEQTVSCKVTGKDPRIAGFNASPSPLRVYSENCDVFVIEDIPIRFFFNTADIYGKIEPGNTYTFTTYGVRWPVFSFFPHIVNAEEVKQ